MTQAARDPKIQGILRLPFAEQAAFFRGKLGNLLPSARWTDVQRAQHDRGVMVSGAMTADILSDFAAAIDRFVVEGKSLDAFRTDFDAIVERYGWAYNGARNWRTRTIYRTNSATAYAAGRLAQLRAGKFAYWMYRHGGSSDPRPEHLAWDGLVLPSDHEFWQTHYPPNAFNCSCRVIGLRDPESARALGGDPDKMLPSGWDEIDPKTGAPRGIGAGWDYQPGNTVSELVGQMAEKTVHWDSTLAKAYMQAVPPAQRDAISEAFRSLPSLAKDAVRYARNIIDGRSDVEIPAYRTLGLLTTRDVDQVKQLTGVEASGFDYSLDPSSVAHVQRKHGDPASEARRGQRAVTANDYARIPAMLNEPDAIVDAGTSDVGRPSIRIEKKFGAELYVAVFEVRPGRKMVALQTLWIRSP